MMNTNKGTRNNYNDNNNNRGDGIFACCTPCCLWLNNLAFRINGYIEEAFCAVGYIIGQWPVIILSLVLLFLGLCCIGFAFLEIERDIFNLWTLS